MNSLKKNFIVILIVFFCAPAAAHMGATGPTLERMNAMTQLQNAVKAIYAATKSDNPNEEDIEAAFKVLKRVGAELPELFAKEHLPEISEASPKIWSDPDGFAQTIRGFDAEISLANELIDAGNVKDALKNLAQSCKSCHTLYRAPKN